MASTPPRKTQVGSEDYELLSPAFITSATPSERPRRTVLGFFFHNIVTLTALSIGTAGALACFAFTFWLSQQRFECPSWALACEVHAAVQYIVSHLQQVQGAVGTVYGACIAMMAFAAYQLAETTIWPVLVQRGLTLANIDQYLASTRGSMGSSVSAMWHARSGSEMAVLVIALLVALLLELDSILVGQAFSTQSIPRTYISNHPRGGGVGYGFSQSNPPGPVPGGVGLAYPVYNSWANGLSDEPMPEYRNFIADRSNLSSIGNFSVPAIDVQRNINCSGEAIVVEKETNYDTWYWNSFKVKTHTDPGSDTSVWLRLEPQLTLWVDSSWPTGNASAVTRLFFAAINGTIQGGHSNPPNATMSKAGMTGVSSLACDVDVAFVERTLTVGSPDPDAFNSSAMLAPPANFGSDEAVWFAAVLTTFGLPVEGKQPMFTPGTYSSPNSSYALPVAYTTMNTINSDYWSQETLKNFIDVGSGALGLVITRSWPFPGGQNLTSSYAGQGLSTPRSFILLVPIGFMLASIAIQMVLSGSLHRAQKVDVARLGITSELVAASQTSDFRRAVGEIKKQRSSTDALKDMKVRYGSDGGEEGFTYVGVRRDSDDKIQYEPVMTA